MQAYMEDRRNPSPAPTPAPLAEPQQDVSDRPLKARNPDLYYGNSHIESYHFCQQCEDHFETVGAKGHKRVPFATFFLKDRIHHRWQQHKTRIKRNRAAPLSWEEFKTFLKQSLGESDAFVGNAWCKMRSDSQHQLEEVQDWAAHLKHLQSILLEFDADCAPLEGQLGRTFYDWLRPSIKLWIDKVGRQQLPWDKLVKAANGAKVKALINNNQHPDQRYTKGKRLLKLTLKDSNKQSSEKTKAAPPQQKSADSLQSKQAVKQARKERKNNWHRKEREKKEAGANSEGTLATGSNATRGKKKAGQNRGQNKGQNRSQRDLSQVTFWTCDKKGHYVTDCKEPPKPKN